MPSASEIQKVWTWRAICEKYAGLHSNLMWQEIFCIIWGESTGNPQAVNPGDPSWGLMQITAPIAKMYGGIMTAPSRSLNPLARLKWPLYGYEGTHPVFDPEINVKCGSYFLSDLKRKWGERFGNYHWVAAYNEGEPALLRGVEDMDYVGGFIARMNLLAEYLQQTSTIGTQTGIRGGEGK